MAEIPNHAEETARLEAAIDAALQADSPLVVGPWLGEVGYELLYWVPFVRWALSTRRVNARPIIIVSRGGVASWYGSLGQDRYIDAFSLFAPDALAAMVKGHKKKPSIKFGDRAGDAVFDRVVALHDLTGVSRLLPLWMHQVYRPFWHEWVDVDGLVQRARWGRVDPPPLPAGVDLAPRTYVAVRFYFSRSFPQTEENVRFAGALTETLARHVPVVLLSHPFASDDHHDFDASGTSVRSVADVMTPETNLEVQTAVIGGALAFAGTYGGLSMLPPLCSVPSYAYCSVPYMKPTHELAIRQMIDRSAGAPQYVGGTADGQREAERILRVLERTRRHV
jgi:hypothetical protein